MVVEIIKAIIFGIVEGITEWLPISSTGHLILVEQFLKFKENLYIYNENGNYTDEIYKIYGKEKVE